MLISNLEKYFPTSIKTYYEPFLGSGAIFFHLSSKLEKAYLSDINPNLINAFLTVKNNVLDLIEVLSKMESDYLSLSEDKQKDAYYNLRDEYNNLENLNIRKAALFIGLNHICFNGLYRVNSSNKFNVAHGSHKNKTMFNEKTLKKASQLLQIADIEFKSYESIIPEHNSFMYLDPPYRPLSKTAKFNTYSNDIFDDNAQIKLANYCKSLKINFMLSNSDPKNTNPNDNFFDDLYSDMNIVRIPAKRIINSKVSARGAINELVITNY